MLSKLLPKYCLPRRELAPAGIVVHYFSCRHVAPDDPFDMGNCRDLFLDLNRSKSRRARFMTEPKWPQKRMFASAHLLIGRDGETWKLVEYDQQAYHAGASILGDRPHCNEWTIGIELVGTIGSRFERVQYERLAELVVELSERYGFPREAVAGHDQVRWAAIEAGASAKPKYDPSGRKDGAGDNFDWWYLGKMCNDIKPDPAGVVGLEQLDDVLAESARESEPGLR